MRATRAILAVSLAGVCLRAVAASYSVPGNFATLQAAMNGAPSGSTILVGPGTFGYMQALDLGKKLFFKSTGGPSVTKISGGYANMLLRAENGSTRYGDPNMALTFDGFTFERGLGISQTFAPVAVVAARVTFLNCVFQDNYSDAKGGAVIVYGIGGVGTFVNCLFQNNRTDANAGAVQINGGQPMGNFKDCLFVNNSCRSPTGNEGGAIVIAYGNGRIVNCTFRGNSAEYAGGAIMCVTEFTESMNTVLVHGCVFDGNFARRSAPAPSQPPTEGGAIVIERNFFADIRGCLFTSNVAESAGAVMSYLAPIRIQNCVFDGCIADGTGYLGFGGAVGVNSYDPSFADSPNASLTLEDTLIRNCVAPVGGALFAQGDGYHGYNTAHQTPVTIRNVTIDNCRATTAGSSYGNGGGLLLNLANVQATNLSILNCSAENSGGGFEMLQNSTFVLRNSYIVGCNAAAVGDDYDCPAAPFPSFVNSVRAYNGGSGTASLSALFAAPQISRGPNGWLTYLDLPYGGSPAISPRIGSVPNRGGYAAGAILDPAMTSNTAYTLTSQHSAKQATVIHAPNGIAGVAFGGTSPVLPATIEAENFNTLGSAISYGDLTAGNITGAYRPGESVDIAPDASAGGGYSIGWVEAGEWLEYDFRAPQLDAYTIMVRAASPAGGSYYLQIDGTNVTGTMSIPASGGWSSWRDVVIPGVAISAGDHVLRFVAVTDGFNFDSVRFSGSAPVLSVSTSSMLRTVKVGNDATSLAIRISNIGGGSMVYSMADDAAWLSISPTGGTVAGASTATALASFASAALTTGEYSAVITVAAPSASGSPVQIPVMLRVRPNVTVPGDFDGDASADIAVFYPGGGAWNVLRSSDRQNVPMQLGWSATVAVAADYDGDGRTDFAVFDPTVATWYVVRSADGSLLVRNWGSGTQIPVPDDYDGDGKADIASYDPPTGVWRILQSSNNQTGTYQWGWSQAMPVVADYDGDGRADIATYVPSAGQWAIRQSSSGQARIVTWGWGQAMPVPADYDGDGRDDIAVYVPGSGIWSILQSSTGTLKQQQWGWSQGAPVPADYDGDGKADIAIYTPASGLWQILKSSGGVIQQGWGWSQAVPVMPQFQVNRRWFPAP